MSLLPTALTATLFNEVIPDALVNSESIVRILVFAMPALFSIGDIYQHSNEVLALCLVGAALYYLSYEALACFPHSVGSTSMTGFVAIAYTNLLWMIGLGQPGETFDFPAHLRYRPVFFIVPVVSFLSHYARGYRISAESPTEHRSLARALERCLTSMAVDPSTGSGQAV